MVQQQGIVKGDVLQRIGSAGFIIGAILLVIFNLLFPRAADPANTQEVLRKIGEQEVLARVCALLLAVGIWAVMLGTAGVYRSISTGGGSAWARLGFYGIVVGTAMWTITFAWIIGGTRVAAEWVTAPAANQATAYSVAAAVHTVGGAVESMAIIVFWSAIAFLGIGMVLSAVYPRWTGWAGIVLGIATLAVSGIVAVFAEPSSALEFIFMVLSLLTVLWALALGIWVARKAW